MNEFYLVVGFQDGGAVIFIEDPRTEIEKPLAFETMEDAKEGVNALVQDPTKPDTLTGFGVWRCHPVMQVDRDGKGRLDEAAVLRVGGIKPLEFCGSCLGRLQKATTKAMRKAKGKKCGHAIVCSHQKCKSCAILRGEE